MRYLSAYRRFIGVIALAMAALSVAPPARPESTDTADQRKIFSGTSETRTTADVFAIDVATNSVVLIDEAGHVVNVVVDKSVGDVKKLKVGDKVSVTYTRALLLRADRSASSTIRQRVDTQMTMPASGGSTTSVHRVQALATVVGIDRANRMLTLRGPTRTVILQANADSFLDGLKEGDSIRVDYAEATAVRILRDDAPLR